MIVKKKTLEINPSDAFITTWRNSIDNESITIYTNPYIDSKYDYHID